MELPGQDYSHAGKSGSQMLFMQKPKVNTSFKANPQTYLPPQPPQVAPPSGEQVPPKVIGLHRLVHIQTTTVFMHKQLSKSITSFTSGDFFQFHILTSQEHFLHTSRYNSYLIWKMAFLS